MKNKPTSDELMAAIRAKCLDCCGGSRKEVAACREKCALNQWRMGEARERPRPMKGQVSLFELIAKESAV